MKSSGAPLFVLANVVDDIDMGITHVIRGEDLLPSTPKGLLLWAALAWSGGGLARLRPPAPARERNRQKLSKRRDTWPSSPIATRATWPMPCGTTWRCSVGATPTAARSCRSTEMVGRFRLEDVNHAPAFFDVDKLEVAERRVHPGHVGGRVRRGGPALDLADRWRRGRRSASTRTCSADGATGPGAGGGSRARCRRWSTSSSSPSPSSTRRLGGRRSRRRGAPAILEGALDAYRECDWTADALHEVHPGAGRRGGPEAGQGAGADPGGGHRSPGGSAAVRVAGGPGARRRYSTAWPRWPTASGVVPADRRPADENGLRPSAVVVAVAAGRLVRLLHRLVRIMSRSDRPGGRISRRHRRPGLADIAPLRGGHCAGGRGHGCGPVRRGAVPRSGGTAAPGATTCGDATSSPWSLSPGTRKSVTSTPRHRRRRSGWWLTGCRRVPSSRSEATTHGRI